MRAQVRGGSVRSRRYLPRRRGLASTRAALRFGSRTAPAQKQPAALPPLLRAGRPRALRAATAGPLICSAGERSGILLKIVDLRLLVGGDGVLRADVGRELLLHQRRGRAAGGRPPSAGPLRTNWGIQRASCRSGNHPHGTSSSAHVGHYRARTGTAPAPRRGWGNGSWGSCAVGRRPAAPRRSGRGQRRTRRRPRPTCCVVHVPGTSRPCARRTCPSSSGRRLAPAELRRPRAPSRQARSSSHSMRHRSRWRCLLQLSALALQSLPSARGWPQRPSTVSGAQCENLPCASTTSIASACPSLWIMALALSGRGDSAALEARCGAASPAGAQSTDAPPRRSAAALAVGPAVGLVAPLVGPPAAEQVALCRPRARRAKHVLLVQLTK